MMVSLNFQWKQVQPVSFWTAATDKSATKGVYGFDKQATYQHKLLNTQNGISFQHIRLTD